MSFLTSDLLPHHDNENSPAGTEETAVTNTTPPDGDHLTEWKVATKTAGITPATIIAGRLQANGIPARAWQEGAGQAIGLTVGLLGNGYVMVPESFLDEAKALLAEEFEEGE
jgi:hypothetical protein